MSRGVNCFQFPLIALYFIFFSLFFFLLTKLPDTFLWNVQKKVMDCFFFPPKKIRLLKHLLVCCRKHSALVTLQSCKVNLWILSPSQVGRPESVIFFLSEFNSTPLCCDWLLLASSKCVCRAFYQEAPSPRSTKDQSSLLKTREGGLFCETTRFIFNYHHFVFPFMCPHYIYFISFTRYWNSSETFSAFVHFGALCGQTGTFNLYANLACERSLFWTKTKPCCLLQANLTVIHLILQCRRC